MGLGVGFFFIIRLLEPFGFIYNIYTHTHTHSYLFVFILIWEREEGGEKEREKHRFVVPLIYAFTGCFLYVSWPETEPTTWAFREDALPTEQPSQGRTVLLLNDIIDCVCHMPLSQLWLLETLSDVQCPFATALLSPCRLLHTAALTESIYLIFGLPLSLLPSIFPSTLICYILLWQTINIYAFKSEWSRNIQLILSEQLGFQYTIETTPEETGRELILNLCCVNWSLWYQYHLRA